MGFSRTVVTPADSDQLVSLADVKDELGISGTADDALLNRWIAADSARITQYCGRDTWGQQTVTDRWQRTRTRWRLHLHAWPVSAVTAVAEGQTDLTADDWRLDDARFLQRIVDDTTDRAWPRLVIKVTYTGGYTLPADAPATLADVTHRLIKARWHAKDRDPAMRSESVEGIGSAGYIVPGLGMGADFVAGLPPDIAADLADWRTLNIG